MISIDEYLIPCVVAGLIIAACYLISSITVGHLLPRYVNIIFDVIFMWVSINIACDVIKYILL